MEEDRLFWHFSYFLPKLTDQHYAQRHSATNYFWFGGAGDFVSGIAVEN